MFTHRFAPLVFVCLVLALGCGDDVILPPPDAAGPASDGSAADAARPVDAGSTVTDARITEDSSPLRDAAVDSPPFQFAVEPMRTTLVPGTCLGVKAKVVRTGYAGMILIGFGGGPDYVGASTTHIDEGATEGDIIFITRTTAPVASAVPLIVGASGGGAHVRVNMLLDVVPRPAGDGGAPDGGFNQSPFSDAVCSAVLAGLDR